MRKLRVRHKRLPGIGDLFELGSRTGMAVSVVSLPSGGRHLSIGPPEEDEPIATVALSRSEATALAALLVGAHIELITTQGG
jgi:K+/H+ antiporter YhaU regulatory subunit KhtT